MKKFAALCFSLCLLAAPAFAEKSKAPGEAEVNAIIERAAPSDTNNINVLSPLSGEWEYSVSVWLKPGVEPQKATGKMTSDMVLGNRFLSSTIMGSVNVAGHETPLNGQGLIGYDNAKESFSSVWTDTLSTGMTIGNGKYDEKAKTITETGRFTNPFNGAEEKFRAETRLVDAGNYERTVYTTGKSGKEAKLMEFQFTKKM